MSTPLLGTIMPWAPNFAPRGWQFCAGQLLSIAQHTAVFSLVGTMYGGNGQTTFALPDLRGRVPVGVGQGPGLSAYVQGEMGGTENVTLTSLQMPMHNHLATFTGTGGGMQATINGGDTGLPSAGAYLANIPNVGLNPVKAYDTGPAPTPEQLVTLGGFTPGGGSVVVNQAGGSQPFGILQPYLAINFIFAMEGIFPSRN